MTRFRLATYNVHKCKGMDWRVSVDRVAAVMAEVNADLTAVQEILQSQAETISLRLATPFIFGCARQHQKEPYGNAVFTRLPVLSSESYDITVPGREPRQCLRASVELTQDQPLHLFAVHFGTSISERNHQAQRLLSTGIVAKAAFMGARVVAGDFNEWTRGVATQLLSRHLKSAEHKNTYPGALPFLHLDHIYYDPAFHLQQMHLHRTRLALLASDHLPLIATFHTDTGPL